MVVKNPFLSEKDTDKKFIARNENAYRGLSSLFPAANLRTLTQLTELCNKKQLPTRQRIYKTEESRRTKSFRPVTHAAIVLRKELGDNLTYKTYQNYLDLACDLRLIKRMPNEFILHSYGKPLVILSLIKNWSNQEMVNDLSWKCYFIDRLLFEDGDYVRVVLDLIHEGTSGHTSRELGVIMHEKVFLRLKEKLREKTLPYTIRNFAERKIAQYEQEKRKSKRSLRRTELEYTVRRDWLVELGLVEMNKEEFSLTENGNYLYNLIKHEEFDTAFFTSKLFNILSEVYKFRKKSVNVISLLEKMYDKITGRKNIIVETLVLINTAILASIPYYIGERDDILRKLKDAYQQGDTRLVLQSGYRTKDYYVKSR